MSKTVIIGGGITGLATAFALQGRGCEFVLLESSEHWGGKIVTVQEQLGVPENVPVEKLRATASLPL